MTTLANNPESRLRFPVRLELTAAECELIALALNSFCNFCSPVVFCDTLNYKPADERITAEHAPLTRRFFQLSRQFKEACQQMREKERIRSPDGVTDHRQGS